ncbi:hypothetical protein HRbin10_01764 [bacterium HR10]|nr:hypothetical protein HRbin10_01764 [bacterium HR10]
MTLKIESRTTVRLNLQKLTEHIHSVLETIPREHLRGVSKLVLVDYVTDSRLDPQTRRELPGLYHPRMPGSPHAWLEIALKPLTPEGSFWKRLSARLALKANVTATLLSLIAQHYYLTLSHGVRKGQYEQAIRSYVDRQLSIYARTRKGWRARLIRPFLPWLEKLARWLQKKYHQQARQRRA